MSISDITTRLADLEDQYNKMFDETMPSMVLDDKRLKEIIKEQISLQVSWELLSKKANLLYDDAELLVEETFAYAIDAAFKAEKYKEINISEAKERARTDQSYKLARRTINKIRSLRDEIKGILETVISRKYLINSLSNSMVAGVENTII